MLSRYLKDTCWPLTYICLLDKRFSRFLRLNWYVCLIDVILSLLFKVTLELHIQLYLQTKWKTWSHLLASSNTVSPRSSVKFVPKLFRQSRTLIVHCSFAFWFFCCCSFCYWSFSCSLPVYLTSFEIGCWTLTYYISLRFFHFTRSSFNVFKIHSVIICWLSYLHPSFRLPCSNLDKEHKSTIWCSQFPWNLCYQITSFITSSDGITHHAIPLFRPDTSLWLGIEVGVKLLRKIRKELLHSPTAREVNQFVDMALLFSSEMDHLKPSLTRKFN